MPFSQVVPERAHKKVTKKGSVCVSANIYVVMDTSNSITKLMFMNCRIDVAK